MEENKKLPMAARVLNFNTAYKAPEYVFKKAKKLVTWGNDNLYPNELLDLYNNTGGPRHKMIINKKVRYISGQGFNDITDANLKAFVENNDLETEIQKIALDYEIFNGFSFEIVWSNDGKSIASIKHMPIAQNRFGLLTDNMVHDYFWFCKEWKNTKKYEPTPILKFNPNMPISKQMTWYCEYNPKNTLVDYPEPIYSAAINAIKTDYKLDVYNLNNVSQGFFPSFNLNFATGIPSQEEQDEFMYYFEKEFMGPENTNRVFITYTDPNESHEAPTLTKIDLNDSDKRFEILSNRIENNLVQGSAVPPQMIILTPGKLGSTEERANLMLEFQKDYISPRQKVIEKELNKILSFNGYTEKLTLKNYTE